MYRQIVGSIFPYSLIVKDLEHFQFGVWSFEREQNLDDGWRRSSGMARKIQTAKNLQLGTSNFRQFLTPISF